MAAGLSEVIQTIVGKLPLLAVQDLDSSVLRLGALAIEQVIAWGPEPKESQRVSKAEAAVFLCMCVYKCTGMSEFVYIHVYTFTCRG